MKTQIIERAGKLVGNQVKNLSSLRPRFRTGALILLGAVFMLTSAGCGSDEDSSTAKAATITAAAPASDHVDSINILTWEGYHDQPWVDEWTAVTGVEVNVTNVGSPAEMFAKAKANPGQYDIIYVTSGWYKNYVDDDLVIPVDESRIPNISLISDVFPWRNATTVDGENYGVLYAWGDQALGWNIEAMKNYDISQYMNDAGQIDDWNILWDPQFEGKVTIFDDPTSVQPMIALALGFEDPFNLTDEQFELFREKLLALRPQVKKLTSGFDDQKTTLATEEAIIGYINNGQVILDVTNEGIPLAINHTVSQGVPAWSDNATISKEGGAKKLDAVYDFINATIDPQFQARFTRASGGTGTLNYDQAIAAGLTDDEMEVTLIPASAEGDAFFASMVFFKEVEDLDKRLELWNEFKLGIGN
jgi:spermidine/putrescine-binding protein